MKVAGKEKASRRIWGDYKARCEGGVYSHPSRTRR